MQDMEDDDAQGDVHVHGAPLAIHRDEDRGVTNAKRGARNAVILVTDHEAGLPGIIEAVVRDSVGRKLKRDKLVAYLHKLPGGDERIFFVAP